MDDAREYAAAGRFAAAQIALKNAVRLDPNNPTYRRLLAEVSLQLGDSAAAEKEFNRARELGMPPDRAQLALGKTLLRLGKYSELLAVIDPALATRQEERTQLEIMQAQAYASRGDSWQAKTVYREVLERTPAADAYAGLAELAMAEEQLDQAEQLFTDATALAIPSYRAWLGLGNVRASLGKTRPALDAFEQAIMLSQGEAELQVALAVAVEAAAKIGELDRSTQYLERLAGTQPDAFRFRILKARVLAGQGSYAAAEKLLAEGLSSQPYDIPALLLMSVVSYATGNLPAADRHLTRALELDPGNSEARRLMAKVRMGRGHYAEVLEALDALPAAGQSAQDFLQLRAQANVLAGNLEAGIAELERIKEANPSDRAIRLPLAAAYLLQGQRDAALDLLDATAATASHDPRAELLVFLASIQAGRMAEAKGQGDALVQRNLQDPGMCYFIGIAFLAAQKPGLAAPYWELALKAQPDHVPTMLVLARSEMASGQLDAARSRLTAVLQAQPLDYRPLLALAHLERQAGDPGTALALLQQATELETGSAITRITLAQALLLQGDFQGALAAIAPLQETLPNDPLVLQLLGSAQLGAGQLELARINLARLHRLRPESGEALYLYALAQLALGESSSGMEFLRRADALSPENPQAAVLLVNLYLRRGDLLAARGEQREAAEQYRLAAAEGRSAIPVLRLHNALREMGDPAAMALLRDWLQQHPEDETVRFALARSLAVEGHSGEAVQSYKQLLSRDPNHVAALNNLAWLLHGLGDGARALPLAAHAYELAPGNAGVIDTYGWILLHQGNVERGAKLLREATALAPEAADIHFHLAVALVEAGERGPATTLLRKLLAGELPFDSRQEAIGLLETLE